MDALAVATVALAITTGLLVFVGLMQWKKMAIHAEHLQALTEQTCTIAQAAKDNARTAELTARATLAAMRAQAKAEMYKVINRLTRPLRWPWKAQ